MTDQMMAYTMINVMDENDNYNDGNYDGTIDG